MDLKCPYCAKVVADVSVFPRLPRLDDIIVCYHCTNVSQFNPLMILVKVNEALLPDDMRQEIEVFRHLHKNALFVHCEPHGLH